MLWKIYIFRDLFYRQLKIVFIGIFKYLIISFIIFLQIIYLKNILTNKNDHKTDNILHSYTQNFCLPGGFIS